MPEKTDQNNFDCLEFAQITLKNTMIDTIIFDLDGVLINLKIFIFQLKSSLRESKSQLSNIL